MQTTVCRKIYITYSTLYCIYAYAPSPCSFNSITFDFSTRKTHAQTLKIIRYILRIQCYIIQDTYLDTFSNIYLYIQFSYYEWIETKPRKFYTTFKDTERTIYNMVGQTNCVEKCHSTLYTIYVHILQIFNNIVRILRSEPVGNVNFNRKWKTNVCIQRYMYNSNI